MLLLSVGDTILSDPVIQALLPSIVASSRNVISRAAVKVNQLLNMQDIIIIIIIRVNKSLHVANNRSMHALAILYH
jgi:hypothetical protein